MVHTPAKSVVRTQISAPYHTDGSYAHFIHSESPDYSLRIMSHTTIFNPCWRWIMQLPFRHECVLTNCNCTMFTGVVTRDTLCTTCGHMHGWHRPYKTSILYENECVVCLDANSTVRLSCRHLCVCDRCFHQIDRCPLCRAKIIVL